ncbi:glycosyltransferase [Xanthocytophaga agilis]|uniref:Glycosyltransferase n=1 Tax=Xanthocytophaga agilis TaxID=3048010 RepID=A0AAE3UH84_9BACT|nr:glycosyltransferase [Xanthocytophaga agilis]MDJ1505768.1 glycosyltransferase [Xanthocytophaga agilis]
MKKILFITFPAKGHINAILGIAKILQQHYKIYLTGGVDPALDLYVEKQGFEIVKLANCCPNLSFVDEVNYLKRFGKNKKDVILNRISHNEYKLRKQLLNELIERLEPEIIFLDSFIGSDFVNIYPCIKNTCTKFFLLNTMLASYLPYLPLPQSDRLPDQKLNTWFEWYLFLVKDSLRELKEKILLVGNTTRQIVRRQARQLAIPAKYKLIDQLPLGIGFTHVKELILCPQEMEFQPYTSPLRRVFTTRSVSRLSRENDRIYLGSQIALNRQEQINKNDIARLVHLLNQPLTFVYISFGTLYQKQRQMLSEFISRIIDVSTAFDSVQFIISGLFNHTAAPTSNVAIFDYVPQTYVLPKASVFITHGGLNSIKESIHFCVPMIVYPVNPNYDQPGNAARVVHHKIGLRGCLHKDTRQIIKDKINDLLTNPSYRDNISRLQERTRQRYTEQTILNIVNSELGYLN